MTRHPGPAALLLARGDFDAIVTQARECAPAECCGILAGASNGRVTRVYPMTNAKDSHEEFLMDPAEQFAVRDDVERRGIEMVAVYHSHPATPSRPSAHDVAMAFYPHLACMIVSLAADEPVVKAFRIVDGEVAEIPVRVAESPAGCSGAETQAIHAGQLPDPLTGSRATPIYLTTSFVFPSADEAAARFALRDDGFVYTRLSNPTTTVLEERWAALEAGTGALATASGQAAELIAVLTLAASGDNVVSSMSVYGGTWTLFLFTLARMGIEVRFVPLDDLEAVAQAIDAHTKAVYCETVGNPGLDVADVPALADLAHGAGVPLIVDNTFAGPFVCRPLEHGADVVVESLTKYAGGHGTVIGGVVVDGGRFPWDEEIFPAIAGPDPSNFGIRFADRFAPAGFVAKARFSVMRDLGACISPFNSFILLQGIETLPLRMERHCANARTVAEFLAGDTRVEQVEYPGLPGHATHEVAVRLFDEGRFGGMVGFDVKGGREAGSRFIDSLRVLSHLANLGDGKSLVIHPASTTHSQLTDEQLDARGIRPGFIRLSVGLESLEDILADLDQALSAAVP